MPDPEDKIPNDASDPAAAPPPAEGPVEAPGEAVEGAAAPAPVPTPPPAAAPAGEALDAGVEALKSQLAAERAQREQLQRQLREETGRRSGAESSAHEAKLAQLKAEHERIGRDGELVQAELETALAAGDHKAAAKAQRLLARIEAAALQVSQAFDFVSTQRPQGSAEGRQGADEAYADPIEKFAAQLSPRSAAWLRQHPECATDRSKNNAMIGAHYTAVAAGIEPESDAYYAHIEQALGYAQKPAPTQRTAPPPAAPSSGSVPTAPARPGTTTITLTPEQRAMAKDLEMTEKEYAEHLVAIRRESGQAMH